MDNDAVIARIQAAVQARLDGEGSGHDWWHVHRVWRMARRIGQAEGADLVVVELAALLHDIADWKFHGGDETVGPRVAREMLARHDVPNHIAATVATTIAEISFKGEAETATPSTLEGRVVQDADRLDAIGAIGVGRAFAYGGHKNRAMYDPRIPPVRDLGKQAYLTRGSPTINHFYEKLLLLHERMNTATGRRLATERHQFLRTFLEQFMKEWSGDA